MDPKDEFIKRALAHRFAKAGSHQDGRDKRKRTRKAADQAAIKDQEEK